MRKPIGLIPLLALCLMLSSSCTRQLQSGVSESEAQQIVVLLRANGIHAEAKPEPNQKKGAASWQVNVAGPSSSVVKAWNLLHENGLPRQKVKGLDDVFANAGMIPTAAEEKARLMTGLSGELTRALDSLPGVVDAKVQVVLPDNSPLVDESRRIPTTASVLIQYHGPFPPLQESEVKNLTAKAVEGLATDNVAVVFKKVEIRSIPEEAMGPISLNSFLETSLLSLAGLASLGTCIVLFLSKKQKRKIKKLEQQLTQTSQAA